MKLDVLAFAAHPDDLEITCGGTLLKLVDQGYKVGACDMTRGEMGTYGTALTRQQELEEAGRRLGLVVRANAGLPDSGLFNTREQQAKVVEVLREHRPELVIVPGHDQRHPDHRLTPQIVFDACFFAGLVKFGTGEKHRPRKIVYVHTQYTPHPPSFVVDITGQMDRKLRAVAAYATQFPEDPREKGLANLEMLYTRMRDRARGYGLMIDRSYGEGFYQREMIEVPDLMKVLGASI